MSDWVHKVNPINGIPKVWRGESVVLIAGGPSLTKENVLLARELQKLDKVKVIGCNDAYRVFPTLDILYAADTKWWEVHYDNIVKTSTPKLKMGANANKLDVFAKGKGIYAIKGESQYSLSYDPHKLHWGGNSGFQIFNIAFLLGATKFFMLGYDMGRVNNKGHWFGEHPTSLRTTKPEAFGRWARAYSNPKDVQHFKENGLKVYNCSLVSSIDEFEKVSFRDAVEKEFVES